MKKIKSFRGSGGAMLVDSHIPGVTTILEYDADKFYSGGESLFFVAESMTETAIKEFSAKMGFEYCGDVKLTQSSQGEKYARVFPATRLL